jgi:hypothetical protein
MSYFAVSPHEHLRIRKVVLFPSVVWRSRCRWASWEVGASLWQRAVEAIGGSTDAANVWPWTRVARVNLKRVCSV